MVRRHGRSRLLVATANQPTGALQQPAPSSELGYTAYGVLLRNRISLIAPNFADDVAIGLLEGLELKDATDAAVDRWMGWTIGRDVEAELGIPRGLPYLAGFVGHYEVMAEAADGL